MRRIRVKVADGELTGISFGNTARPIDALFLHANGFNAMTYQTILAPLGSRSHVAALDLRGHGKSTAPAIPGKLKGWNVFRDDVIRALEELAPEGTVICGHSMGAHIALLVAGKRRNLAKGLVMADPVMLSPSVYRWAHLPGNVSFMKNHSPMAKGAKRRRAEFASPEVAKNLLEGRGAFATWREPFLDDYIHDGLTPDEGEGPDKGYHLSCAPEWEAACFGAHRHRPWNALRQVKCPIVVLRAERNSTISNKSVEKLLRMKPRAMVITPQGTSHFLPMERPYAVRDAISQMISYVVEGINPMEDGPVQRNLDPVISLRDYH